MIDVPDIGFANSSDARAIALLSRSEIEYGLAWGWTLAAVLRAIEDKSTNVIVARHGRSMAGFALMKYNEEDAQLVLLGVDPVRRRKGIATALISWLEHTVRVAGLRTIQVQVRSTNAGAQAFYAKLGYENVGVRPGFYQGVEDALHLVKELDRGAI